MFLMKNQFTLQVRFIPTPSCEQDPVHLFPGVEFIFKSCWLLRHVSDCNRGFHVGDARLGGVRIFDARVKIQHDAQWSVLTRASIF